jgi:DNA-binding transcriptional LysR family regulator
MDRIAPYHLRTLLAIARLGTFQAAAERLNTTQPAISARIRELEAQLGTALFRRDGRRMALTTHGRQLVQDSEPVLAELDQILMRAAGSRFATGIVRIGTGEIASASCVPTFVAGAQARFPDVTLEIEVDLTARMLERLLAGSSDMVFLAGPVAHPGIVTRAIGSLNLVWLASPAVATAATTSAPQTIWTLPDHSPIHHIVRDAVASGAFRAGTLNSCNNVRTMIDIVAQGGGVGLFPETMVRGEMAAGELIEIANRPRRPILFEAAVRKREADPVISSLFELTADLDIGVPPGRAL